MTAPVIYAVGGGKGGVGKSVVAIALAQALAARSQRVIIVDLDLGAANLHTYLGVRGPTPTLADVLTRKAAHLADVRVSTSMPGVELISGAEYLPGMANLAHATKLKLLRHLQTLPADAVVLDLGAGVTFNTLDFFAAANHGVVVTAPEPAAVMNAYGFIKSALFRQLQRVFRRHESIGPLIEEQARRADAERELTLGWMRQKLQELAPDDVPLLDEVAASLHLPLVVNRADGERVPAVIHNLMSLCRAQLGLTLDAPLLLPDIPAIRRRGWDIPAVLAGDEGRNLQQRMQEWLSSYVDGPVPDIDGVRQDYNDADIAQLQQVLDRLDDFVYAGSNRRSWKLRLYFKPVDVVQFLLRQGVKDPEFLDIIVR